MKRISAFLQRAKRCSNDAKSSDLMLTDRRRLPLDRFFHSLRRTDRLFAHSGCSRCPSETATRRRAMSSFPIEDTPPVDQGLASWPIPIPAPSTPTCTCLYSVLGCHNQLQSDQIRAEQGSFTLTAAVEHNSFYATVGRRHLRDIQKASVHPRLHHVHRSSVFGVQRSRILLLDGFRGGGRVKNCSISRGVLLQSHPKGILCDRHISLGRGIDHQECARKGRFYPTFGGDAS